jgi:hypothetical protein
MEQATGEDKLGGWMGDNIVGIFLSEELLHDSHTTAWDCQSKLRCFVHHQKSIRCVRLLGSGRHGAVVLVVIERAQYVLKVVTLPGTH